MANRSGNTTTTIGLRDGLIAALPVVIGYFPVAMAFGLLARDTHVSLADTALFSLVVFAGASQFLALEFVSAGVSAGSVILATFLLNSRHMLMSASLSPRLNGTRRRWLAVLAFGVTDESFSVASLTPGRLSVPFMLALELPPYLAWSAGTVTGFLLGAVLPEAVQGSLGIGLYALFTALLVPEIRRSHGALFLAGLSGTLYLAVRHFELLPSGWSLIAAVLTASGAGLVFLDDTTTADNTEGPVS
jgi:4-azaleucine resistance transporter AzlC